MEASGLARIQRCAIYTRKSLDDQHDTEFNSIESQRDICAAYVKCQQHRHWFVLPESYDDAGQSGASLYRPSLQRLLRDVEAGEVDVVVVYKIDRLTRSLADFIRIIGVLDHCNVKFVAVTQAFDTSDTMGRLLLNILLTFAQFERELLADRVRDKVAAIKKRGKINGGHAPFGYDIVDHKLVVNPAEAEQVRWIFRTYLEVGSCWGLTQAAKKKGIRAKLYVTRHGVTRGGGPPSNGMLYHVLKNPTYIGRVPHNGDSYPAEHEAIVDEETWQAANALVAERRKFNQECRQPRNILKRLMRDCHGRRMTIETSGTNALRYYRSVPTPWAREQGIARYSIRAEHLEELVVAAVQATLADRERMRGVLRDIGRRGDELDELPLRAGEACEAIRGASFEALREIMRSLLVEGEISQHGLVLVFRSTEVARFLAWDRVGLFEGDRAAWSSHGPSFTINRPLDEVRFAGGKRPSLEPIPPGRRGEPNPGLVQLIETARRAQASVDAEPDTDAAVIARRFKCSPERFYRLVRLNYLAPDIVAAIFAGAHPPNLEWSRLVHGFLPLDWDLQRRFFGFPARADPRASVPPSVLAKPDRLAASGGLRHARSTVNRWH